MVINSGEITNRRHQTLERHVAKIDRNKHSGDSGKKAESSEESQLLPLKRGQEQQRINP